MLEFPNGDLVEFSEVDPLNSHSLERLFDRLGPWKVMYEHRDHSPDGAEFRKVENRIVFVISMKEKPWKSTG